jgi:hypothetical protein
MKKTLEFYVTLLLLFLVTDIFLFNVILSNASQRVFFIDSTCRTNMIQIVYACGKYVETYGSLPAYTVDKDNKPLHSWRVLILPFLDQEELYKSIRLDEPWNSKHNKQFHNTRFELLQCKRLKRMFPDTPINSYFLITGAGSLFGESGEVFRDKFSIDNFWKKNHKVPFLVEVPKNVSWMCPVDISFDEYKSSTFLSSIESHSVVVYADLSTDIIDLFSNLPLPNMPNLGYHKNSRLFRPVPLGTICW